MSANAISQYLTFTIASEQYAVGVGHVKEIIGYNVPTKVPGTPPSIRGAIDLRGLVVPVVDLAVKFGRPENEVTRRPNRMLRCKWLLAAMMAAAPLLSAQEPISDNSFFIEEAYNQEPRVVQHIGTFARMRGGDWMATFTQEWPAFSQQHQVSYTVPFAESGLGDVALNYRYQMLGVGGGPVALAPRVSVLLPTGDGSETAWQVNLPLSVDLSDRFVAHSNAGATFTGSERIVSLGQSLVWLAAPRMNVLVEAVWDDDENFIVSPGIRWAHNLDSGLQIVPGVAFPIGAGPSAGERGVFLYLSFEHGY